MGVPRAPTQIIVGPGLVPVGVCQDTGSDFHGISLGGVGGGLHVARWSEFKTLYPCVDLILRAYISIRFWTINPQDKIASRQFYYVSYLQIA